MRDMATSVFIRINLLIEIRHSLCCCRCELGRVVHSRSLDGSRFLQRHRARLGGQSVHDGELQSKVFSTLLANLSITIGVIDSLADLKCLIIACAIIQFGGRAYGRETSDLDHHRRPEGNKGRPHFMSISFPRLSCANVSCPVLSCPVLSCPVLPCPLLTCSLLSCTALQIMGFNSVRLPIGYWNLMADPYRKYAPLNHRTSLKYIDWCFDTCEKVCGLGLIFLCTSLPSLPSDFTFTLSLPIGACSWA